MKTPLPVDCLRDHLGIVILDDAAAHDAGIVVDVYDHGFRQRHFVPSLIFVGCPFDNAAEAKAKSRRTMIRSF